MLRAGIVGLPNVGKSTLFNALTATRGAESANYPFSTTGTNVGVVNVPDARLEPLAKIAKTNKIVYATVEFMDIAGLAKGASHGEGLGNQFLHHIRESEVIVHVVRCFEDDNVMHVEETIDPHRDIETLNLELVLADLSAIEKRRERTTKQIKAGDKAAKEEIAVLDKLQAVFDEGKPARLAGLTDDEKSARLSSLPAHDEADDLRRQRSRVRLEQTGDGFYSSGARARRKRRRGLRRHQRAA